MFSKILFLFFGLIFNLSFTNISFSTEDISTEKLEIDEIMITGEKITEEMEVKDTTAFATVIKPKDSSTRVSTLSELLSESVGVTIRKYGGIGSLSTISIRGSSSEQVAVFLDGILLNQSRQGTVNLSEIPIDNIEKIEVYRGTSPARFGFPGIGGVLNIVTRSPSKRPQMELSYSFGSYETYKADFYRSESIKDFSYLFYFTLNRSRNNFKYLDDNGTPLNSYDDDYKRRRNNKFFSDDFLIKFGYDWKGLRFILSSDFFNSDQGVPGISNYQSKTASFETLRTLNNFKILKSEFLHPSLNFEFQIFFTYEQDRFQDKKNEIGVGYQDNRDLTISYGGNALISHNTSLPYLNNIFHIYFCLKNEAYDSENEFKKPEKGETQIRRTLNCSADEELYLFQDRLILSPSLIFNHYHNDFNEKLPFTNKWVTPGENRNKGYLNKKMGAEIRFLDCLSIKGNAGRYFRPPNFTELFGDRGTFLGNPSLKAEKSRNWDIGFKLQKNKFLYLKNILFEYAYFKSNYDNLILFIPNSQRTCVATNISKANIKGHEISWASDFFSHLNISGNFTIQKTEDKSKISYWNGNQLPGRPEYELFNKFEIFNNYGKIFYEFNYLSNNYLDRANYTKIAARKIHNLGFSLYATKNLTLTFEIKNLSDARIEDYIGYPLPGRSCFGTIDYKF